MKFALNLKKYSFIHNLKNHLKFLIKKTDFSKIMVQIQDRYCIVHYFQINPHPRSPNIIQFKLPKPVIIYIDHDFGSTSIIYFFCLLFNTFRIFCRSISYHVIPIIQTSFIKRRITIITPKASKTIQGMLVYIYGFRFLRFSVSIFIAPFEEFN